MATVRAFIRKTTHGITRVRSHVRNVSAPATAEKPKSVRSTDLKIYMAEKASKRSKLIRDTRERAIANRYRHGKR